MTRKLNILFGDSTFYRKVFAIALPIMIQSGLTNFVNLIDNIMVGSVGTEQMSAVAIVNKCLFVYTLCIIGACAGTGIFTAQFYGKGDNEGVRRTFRLKLITNTILVIPAVFVLVFFGDKLISLFLHEGSESGNLLLTAEYAKQYLSIMIIGIIPQAISECYSSTLRETENTSLPMRAGVAAIITNLTLNYILIFGNFGAPALGVKGAAIATAISKFTELGILVIAVHRKKSKYSFLKGTYKTLRIPLSLIKTILPKSIPLMLNETMWALGMTALAYCFSLRGLAVVAGYNISSTITDIFNVISIALGSAIAIIVGNLLGADKMKEAKETVAKLIVFSVIVSGVLCVIMFATSPLFPMLYTETSTEAKLLATSFLKVYSFYLILNSISMSCYFTIRSGGKTLITFLFDSLFTLFINFPFALVLATFTNMHIVPLYALTMYLEIIKCVVGLILVRSGKWMQNIVK